jgi:Rieske Fe-S protein
MSDDALSACQRCALQRNGMTRRDFLNTATLAAVSAWLSACTDNTPTAILLNGRAFINLLDYPVLNEIGGIALVTLNGAALAIVRQDQLTYVALSRRCPDQGTEVLALPSGGFQCPSHGATFDELGKWVSGLPTQALTSYPTEVDTVNLVLVINP